MIDNDYHISKKLKSSIITMICPKLKDHEDKSSSLRSLEELRELMETLEVPVIDQHIQKKQSPDPTTVIGKGKLEEIAKSAHKKGISLLVFDFELTASQIRNIQNITKINVADRIYIILEIFSHHAKTREAKIQIEISRLKYMLSRLSGFWTHLGKQRGGVGVKSGEGEKQIELDRRMIRKKIEQYKKEIKSLEKSKQQQSKRRKNKTITAALVGYTNSGKSSLLNRLCNESVIEQNKLFATLDSTYRSLSPNSKPPMILIDTVGFISNLPNTLINGFKSTLESILEADLLIIVCDVSNPHYKKHLETTKKVLNELGSGEKDYIIVFNKRDLIKDKLKEKIIRRINPNSFIISSFNNKDIRDLKKSIIDYLLDQQDHYDIFIPYIHGQAHSKLLSNTNIIKQINHENGIFYRVRVPRNIFNTLGLNNFIIYKKEGL